MTDEKWFLVWIIAIFAAAEDRFYVKIALLCTSVIIVCRNRLKEIDEETKKLKTRIH